jgi:hypothetical protein
VAEATRTRPPAPCSGRVYACYTIMTNCRSFSGVRAVTCWRVARFFSVRLLGPSRNVLDVFFNLQLPSVSRLPPSHCFYVSVVIVLHFNSLSPIARHLSHHRSLSSPVLVYTRNKRLVTIRMPGTVLVPYILLFNPQLISISFEQYYGVV